MSDPTAMATANAMPPPRDATSPEPPHTPMFAPASSARRFAMPPSPEKTRPRRHNTALPSAAARSMLGLFGPGGSFDDLTCFPAADDRPPQRGGGGRGRTDHGTALFDFPAPSFGSPGAPHPMDDDATAHFGSPLFGAAMAAAGGPGRSDTAPRVILHAATPAAKGARAAPDGGYYPDGGHDGSSTPVEQRSPGVGANLFGNAQPHRAHPHGAQPSRMSNHNTIMTATTPSRHAHGHRRCASSGDASLFDEQSPSARRRRELESTAARMQRSRLAVARPNVNPFSPHRGLWLHQSQPPIATAAFPVAADATQAQPPIPAAARGGLTLDGADGGAHNNSGASPAGPLAAAFVTAQWHRTIVGFEQHFPDLAAHRVAAAHQLQFANRHEASVGSASSMRSNLTSTPRPRAGSLALNGGEGSGNSLTRHRGVATSGGSSTVADGSPSSSPAKDASGMSGLRRGGSDPRLPSSSDLFPSAGTVPVRLHGPLVADFARRDSSLTDISMSTHDEALGIAVTETAVMTASSAAPNSAAERKRGVEPSPETMCAARRPHPMAADSSERLVQTGGRMAEVSDELPKELGVANLDQAFAAATEDSMSSTQEGSSASGRRSGHKERQTSTDPSTPCPSAGAATATPPSAFHALHNVAPPPNASAGLSATVNALAHLTGVKSTSERSRASSYASTHVRMPEPLTLGHGYPLASSAMLPSGGSAALTVDVTAFGHSQDITESGPTSPNAAANGAKSTTPHSSPKTDGDVVRSAARTPTPVRLSGTPPPSLRNGGRAGGSVTPPHHVRFAPAPSSPERPRRPLTRTADCRRGATPTGSDPSAEDDATEDRPLDDGDAPPSASDRPQQRHEFLHFIPSHPIAVDASGSPMGGVKGHSELVPLHQDVNGTVWLATSMIDGLPYSVKEVAFGATDERALTTASLERAVPSNTRWNSDACQNETLTRVRTCIDDELAAYDAMTGHRHGARYFSCYRDVAKQVYVMQTKFYPLGTMFDYLVGLTVAQHRLPSEAVIRLALTHVLRGLLRLHERGLLHNNLHPRNCYVDEGDDDVVSEGDSPSEGTIEATLTKKPLFVVGQFGAVRRWRRLRSRSEEDVEPPRHPPLSAAATTVASAELDVASLPAVRPDVELAYFPLNYAPDEYQLPQQCEAAAAALLQSVTRADAEGVDVEVERRRARLDAYLYYRDAHTFVVGLLHVLHLCSRDPDTRASFALGEEATTLDGVGDVSALMARSGYSPELVAFFRGFDPSAARQWAHDGLPAVLPSTGDLLRALEPPEPPLRPLEESVRSLLAPRIDLLRREVDWLERRLREAEQGAAHRFHPGSLSNASPSYDDDVGREDTNSPYNAFKAPTALLRDNSHHPRPQPAGSADGSQTSRSASEGIATAMITNKSPQRSSAPSRSNLLGSRASDDPTPEPGAIPPQQRRSDLGGENSVENGPLRSPERSRPATRLHPRPNTTASRVTRVVVTGFTTPVHNSTKPTVIGLYTPPLRTPPAASSVGVVSHSDGEREIDAVAAETSSGSPRGPSGHSADLLGPPAAHSSLSIHQRAILVRDGLPDQRQGVSPESTDGLVPVPDSATPLPGGFDPAGSTTTAYDTSYHIGKHSTMFQPNAPTRTHGQPHLPAASSKAEMTEMADLFHSATDDDDMQLGHHRPLDSGGGGGSVAEAHRVVTAPHRSDEVCSPSQEFGSLNARQFSVVARAAAASASMRRQTCATPGGSAMMGASFRGAAALGTATAVAIASPLLRQTTSEFFHIAGAGDLASSVVLEPAMAHASPKQRPGSAVLFMSQSVTHRPGTRQAAPNMPAAAESDADSMVGSPVLSQKVIDLLGRTDTPLPLPRLPPNVAGTSVVGGPSTDNNIGLLQRRGLNQAAVQLSAVDMAHAAGSCDDRRPSTTTLPPAASERSVSDGAPENASLGDGTSSRARSAEAQVTNGSSVSTTTPQAATKHAGGQWFPETPPSSFARPLPAGPTAAATAGLPNSSSFVDELADRSPNKIGSGGVNFSGPRPAVGSSAAATTVQPTEAHKGFVVPSFPAIVAVAASSSGEMRTPFGSPIERPAVAMSAVQLPPTRGANRRHSAEQRMLLASSSSGRASPVVPQQGSIGEGTRYVVIDVKPSPGTQLVMAVGGIVANGGPSSASAAHNAWDSPPSWCSPDGVGSSSQASSPLAEVLAFGANEATNVLRRRFASLGLGSDAVPRSRQPATAW